MDQHLIASPDKRINTGFILFIRKPHGWGDQPDKRINTLKGLSFIRLRCAETEAGE